MQGRRCSAVLALTVVLGGLGCRDLADLAGSGGGEAEAEAEVEGKVTTEQLVRSMSTARLPEPIAALEWGMPREKVAAKLPASDGTTYTPTDLDGVTFYFGYGEASKGLASASLYIAKAEASGIVAGAFGEPALDDEEVELWFAPESGLRAVLSVPENNADDKQLTFEPLLPIDEVIGAAGPAARPGALGDKPLLGLTREEVKTRFADSARVVSLETFVAASMQNSWPKGWGDAPPTSQKGSVILEFPPTEWAEARTVVFPMFGPDDKVTDYVMRLDFARKHAAMADAITKLGAKWGTPTKDEKSGKLVFSRDPLIVANERFEGYLDVEIEIPN